MPNLPTGVLTFLFADIQGSLDVWEQSPEAMRLALDRHAAILHAAIAAHAGRVFKTVGESFYGVFTSALEAVLAALAAQYELRAVQWDARHGLSVRMSLHTGDSVARGGDYYGPTLNRVDRLLKAAHGGQVILSQATRELVHACLPDGISLLDLGEHHLKGMLQPEHVFQLCAPDLPAEFPPLQTLGPRRINLPAQATSFVGRKGELAMVSDLLRRAPVRLVTLTGPGGVGKTRLALQVAAELAGDFEDGVCLVSLSSVTDPARVMPAVAQSLGIQESAQQTLVQAVQDYLRDRDVLLVLDNLEHVLLAAPSVSDLLAAAPRLKVLATSRELLKLYGECEYAVPPLTLPDMKHLPRVERLMEMSSVALFVARAQAADPRFGLTDENASAVAQICAKLDGLPLAIELAAARVRLFSPREMLARLDNRLALLTGGGRELPARQQTLRGALDWSYDLLDRRERQLFGRLAVFAGGCTAQAAQAVCNADGELQLDVWEGLASLVDKSLIQSCPGPAPASVSRFVMLATLQEYALEQLTEMDAADTILRRHAEYYRALAEQAWPGLVGPTQVEWLDHLALEHDNLRAAMQWSLTRGYTETALRMCGALWKFWQVRGFLSEGRAWLEKALAVAECEDMPPTVCVQSLYGAGVLAYEQGDLGRAAECFQDSLRLWRAAGDQRGVAQSLNSVANVAFVQGDYARAMAIYEESRAIWQTLHDLPGLATCLSNLGLLAHYQGDDERARAFYEESLMLSRSTGDRRNQAIGLNNLGDVVRARDLARAAELYAESLKLWHDLGDNRGVTSSLNNLAQVARDQGDLERTISFYRDSLALCYELSEYKEMSISLDGLADAFHRRRQARLAAQLLGASDALRESRGVVMPQSYGAEFALIVSQVRASLTPPVFVSVWREGRALPLERAIGLAFDDGVGYDGATPA